MSNGIKLLPIRSLAGLASDISDQLEGEQSLLRPKVQLIDGQIHVFDDRDFLRNMKNGHGVYVIGSTINYESIAETRSLVFAARQHAPVTVVITYLRNTATTDQDLGNPGREMLELLDGIHPRRFVFVDVRHSDVLSSIKDAHHRYPHHVYGSDIAFPFFEDISPLEMDAVIASCTTGGNPRADRFSKTLERDLTLFSYDNFNGEMVRRQGSVRGKRVWFVRDILDSASLGRLIAAAALAHRCGAVEVNAFTTHCALSDSADFTALDKSRLKKVVVTDTIKLDPSMASTCPKIQVHSIASVLTDLFRKFEYAPN